jgi:hypothetical protein
MIRTSSKKLETSQKRSCPYHFSPSVNKITNHDYILFRYFLIPPFFFRLRRDRNFKDLQRKFHQQTAQQKFYITLLSTTISARKQYSRYIKIFSESSHLRTVPESLNLHTESVSMPGAYLKKKRTSSISIN